VDNRVFVVAAADASSFEKWISIAFTKLPSWIIASFTWTATRTTEIATARVQKLTEKRDKITRSSIVKFVMAICGRRWNQVIAIHGHNSNFGKYVHFHIKKFDR
jgi:hypothetical protein